MLQLHTRGWGVKQIARELGCAKNTVKKYVTQGTWHPPVPPARVGVLDSLQPWLAACVKRHPKSPRSRHVRLPTPGVTPRVRDA
jgi:hypothetical protein